MALTFDVHSHGPYHPKNDIFKQHLVPIELSRILMLPGGTPIALAPIGACKYWVEAVNRALRVLVVI